MGTDEGEVLTNPLDNLKIDEIQTPNPTDKDNSDINNEEIKEEEEELEDEEKPIKEEPQKKGKSPEKEIRKQQQEDWKLVEIQRLRNLVIDREVKEASKDITSLLDLQKTDAKLAKEVASKFDWSETSRGDYDNFLISKWAVAEKPTQVSEEEIEKRVEARLAQREHEVALQEAQSKLNELPEELQAEAVEEFNDLIEGRTLTREKALKIAELVTLSLKKGKVKVDTTTPLKKLSSTGISTPKKPVNDDEYVEIIQDNKLVKVKASLLNSNQTN